MIKTAIEMQKFVTSLKHVGIGKFQRDWIGTNFGDVLSYHDDHHGYLVNCV